MACDPKRPEYALKNAKRPTKGSVAILKAKAANFTKKAAELGTGGAILTTVPMALDEDVRQQYYDSEGNFDLGKLTADTMVNTGMLGIFFGIRNVDLKSFRRAKKGITPYDPRFNTTPKYKPFTGNFTGDSKKDFNNIVVKKTDNNSITVSENKSFPNLVKNIKNEIKTDVKHEDLKSKDINAPVNKEKKAIQTSLQNVQNELGPESPFEFFDDIAKTDAGQIDTVKGLKSIEAIVNETISILDRGAIKDKDGEIIGVDASKMTIEDANYLLYVTPTAITSYKGYLLTYNESDQGRNEYIQRFELEKNNGNPISESMRKTVLKALDLRLERFDIIQRDFNSMLSYGDTKSEQIQVNPDNKAPLTQENMEVVLVENGEPVTGDILSIEKQDALSGIEQEKFITKSDAEKQGLDIGEVESLNHGIPDAQELESMLAVAVARGVALREPQSAQIPIKKQDYQSFIQPFKEGKTGNMSLERKVNSQITTSNIKDPYDIAVLGGPDSPISAKDLKKRVGALNSLMESSGKNSLTEITTKDIEKWGNDRIAKIKKENKGKPIDKQTPAVMRNAPVSQIKYIFNALKEKNYLTINPVTKAIQQNFSSHMLKTTQSLKAKQSGLPELKEWYKKMPKVYGSLMSKNKNYKIALAIGDNTSIRSLEIEAIRGKHILRDKKTGIPYIDLTTPTTEDGAAKPTGTMRPVAISEGLYNELIKIAFKKSPDALLFPGYQQTLTKELKKLFPNIKITASNFKNQQIALAEQQANLTNEEAKIFATISGHAGKETSKIIEDYLSKGNMGDLLKLQIKVMKKVNAARLELEEDLKTGTLEKAIKNVMKFVKEDLTVGLTVKDVSGKNPSEVIKTVNNEVKEGVEISKDVKTKFIASLRKVFDNLVPKNIDVAEKSATMSFYAKGAGIEDYNNFNLKSATSEELTMFSTEIMKQPKISGTNTRDLVRRMENFGLAKRIFEAIVKDKFDYVHLAINTDNIINLSKQLPALTKLGLYTNIFKTTVDWFPFLAKKLNAPFLSKVGEDISNRRLAESRIGGYVQDFEETIKKTIYNFAKEKGDFNRLRLLMPHVIRGGTIGVPILQNFYPKLKTYIPLVALPNIQAIGRSLAGDEQYKFKYGEKIFEQHVKHNLWSLDPKRYKNLKEHALAHPEDKVGVKRFEAAKPFHEGVYVTENNYKELGLTKKAIGSLRTDTLESYVAREWNKYTDKLWNHTLLVLEKGMTEAQWDSFQAKYPLVEIKKHFYVPIIHTEVFGDHYGFGQINLDKKILRRGISHAKKHAKKKYGNNPTQSQIDEFIDIGNAEAYTDLAVMQSTYQGSKQNPKHILRRKFYTGERVFIEKENKWVDAIEHDYDMSIRPHAATMAKTIANIEYFPYLVGIPGLKFNHAYPKLLAEIGGKKGGVVGSYINDMILAETGLTAPSNIGIEYMNEVLTSMNKYASRIILMGARSPLKNLSLGNTNNLMIWDLEKVLYHQARSLSYRNRIEARKTGYMGLSLSKLTENEDKLLSVILDKMWHSFKFRSTEESTRLASMFLAMDEVPFLCDALISKNIKIQAEAYDKATKFYEVLETPIQISKDIIIKGGELEILKKLGTDIDFNYDITKKDFGVNRLITVNRELTAMERKILKDEIEKVHFKIISRAHEKAQGSTAPLDQPLILQSPIAGPSALFAKMAITAARLAYKGINHARKYNNWRRFLGIGTGIFIANEALTAFDELLKGLPNPSELDRNAWKKLFRALKTAEFGGIGSLTWGVAAGEMPMGNPVFGFAQAQLVQETLLYLLEKKAQALELAAGKTDMKIFKPEGKSQFTSWFIATKTGWQAEKDLLSTVNGAYREWRAIQENIAHPYRKEQKRFDGWEKHFYNNVMPVSSKPKIIQSHINSAEYREIKDAFELTEFEKDGDFTRINEIIFSTFLSLYDQKIAANNPPDRALKLAEQSINSKLKALDPVINGLGTSENQQGWFSVRDGYLSYLKETAKAQGKDPLYYWKPLIEQKKTYDKKIKSFTNQFAGWLRKNKSKELEGFVLKAMTKIHPESWNLLGLPDLNASQRKRYEKDLDKYNEQNRFSVNKFIFK